MGRVERRLEELSVDPSEEGHARTAMGVAALPLDLPVIIAAEVELSG